MGTGEAWRDTLRVTGWLPTLTSPEFPHVLLGQVCCIITLLRVRTEKRRPCDSGLTAEGVHFLGLHVGPCSVWLVVYLSL